MKKILVLILLVIQSYYLFSEGDKEYSMPSSPSWSGIEYQIDLIDNDSNSSIEQLTRYDIEKDILYRIDTVFEKYEKKLYFEFHIGLVKSFNDTLYIVNDGDLTKQYYTSPEAKVKFNILNPKIYRYENILNEIILIKEIILYYNISLSPDIIRQLSYIENQLLKYRKENQFKRFSIGLGIPFKFDSSNSYQNNILMDELNVFVGYDIMDILTLSVGYNIVTYDDFYIGLSIDVSTPAIGISDSFLRYISDLLRI